MSLILDALRKSEAERRRGQAPDLYSTVPAPSTRVRPAWQQPLPWLVVLALLLAGTFLFWPRQESDEAQVADATVHTVDTSAASSAPARRVDGPLPAIPTPLHRTPAPAPATTLPAGSLPTAPTVPTPAVAVNPVAAPPAIPLPTISEPGNAAESAAQDEALPTIALLSAGERAALPPLKLSMHVWAADAAKRIAIVDGQRVSQGSTIGPSVVAEIRRDGVVLDINGRRLLLPRP